MKKYIVFSLSILLTLSINCQENIDELLAAGVEDAKQFSTDYLAPATEGTIYSINNGWFNNAKSPHKFGVEISLIGNISFIQDEKKSFVMNVADYQNIRFPDDASSKSVATALGHNDPDAVVMVTYEDPVFGDQEVALTLPTGIGSENINLIPSAFFQASFSPFKGTQIKGRFFPITKAEDVEIGMYGFGLQQEFTSWLPADKVLPISISGLVAYTHLDGKYSFEETSVVQGENQRTDTDINTILAQLIVATNLKIINFYGALGYLSGESKTDLLGTYIVTDGALFSEELIDPYSVEQKVSGVRASLGAHLKLGFFGLNLDYTVAEFNSASLGINFSI
ncbi:DUF6588 family protein [Yeosuana sp. MJ-SS3]|uniref:DUF6588 family protein n=1 Tax=Gilvirhabdus luticola TaxID=3079858 RepID=A0ABU3U6E7_9FLAO|nr:DUF6588 family protein [Yeosuana sp. MJ-SS3]MDU8885977.1 DUF6588 family protein [Yeosuana sp. MJ-SS3]